MFHNATPTTLTLITTLALALTLAIPTPAYPQSSSSKTKTSSKSESKPSSKSSASSSKSSSKTSSKSSTSNKSDSTKTSGKSESSSDNADAAAYSAAANQPINPQSFNDQMLSELVFDLTNVERIRAGLRPFETNRHLSAAATAHSRDMASRNYFNHKSKGIFNRTDPHERIASAGYQPPRMTAENIAMIPTFNSQRIQSNGYGNQVVETDYNSYNRMAAYAVKQWMESKGHRENILNRSLTELGVGVAIGLRQNVPYVYLTQNFGG